MIGALACELDHDIAGVVDGVGVVAQAAGEAVAAGAAGQHIVARGSGLHHVGHADGHGLGGAEAVLVGDLDRERMGGLGFEVDGRAGLDPDLIAGESRTGGGAAGQGEAVGVAGIRIHRAERADHGAGGCVFLDRAAGQRDAGRRRVGRQDVEERAVAEQDQRLVEQRDDGVGEMHGRAALGHVEQDLRQQRVGEGQVADRRFRVHAEPDMRGVGIAAVVGRIEAAAALHRDGGGPEAVVAVVAVRDRVHQGRVAGLEVIAGIGVAGRDRVLEPDVVVSALGREAVAVPVFAGGALAEVVLHHAVGDDDIVRRAIERDADDIEPAEGALAVADHVVDQHIVRVVLQADHAARIVGDVDVLDREAADGRGRVGARGVVLDEAGDVAGVDVADGEVGDVRADPEHAVAEVPGGEVLEHQVVGAGQQAEQLVALAHAVGPAGRARSHDLRRHRIAAAVDATDGDGRALGSALGDRELGVLLVGALVRQ